MSFKATDEQIYSLINDCVFIIPDNQRKYIWKKDNWKELFDDIVLVYENKLDKHFIGSVVLLDTPIDDGINSHFTIIDGQQRILTISTLFIAIAVTYANHKEYSSFSGLEKFLIAKDNKATKHTIVSKNANVDISELVHYLFVAHYDDIVAGIETIEIDSLFSKIKINKKIKDCFIFFYNELNNLIGDDIKLLDSFQNAVQSIKYIRILTKDEDAYTIFEILNARGKPLTDFELLRNFLLKYSNPSNKEEIKVIINTIETSLGDYCNTFLKHYVVHKYKVDANSALKAYKVIADNEKKSDVVALAKDLLLKCSYYEKITNFNGCSILERKIFSFFKTRRQQQFRPILLGLMHQLDLKNLDVTTYEDAIDYLYSFFLCYNVIGEQTSNKIEDIVNGYSYKIENAFEATLIAKMKESMWKRIPSEEYFKNSIKHIKYSNCRPAYSGAIKADNVKAILQVLELEKGYAGEFDDMTIEHCFPDSVSEDNDTIGNLILLESDLNEQCGDKELIDKINYYRKSNFTMAKRVAEIYDNKEFFDISKRTESIAFYLFNYLKRLS